MKVFGSFLQKRTESTSFCKKKQKLSFPARTTRAAGRGKGPP
jgi:hypothetical protein